MVLESAMQRLARLHLPTEYNPPHMLLALVFVGVGLLLTYLLGRVTTLTCQRPPDPPACIMTTTWMGLTQLQVRALPQLITAEIEEDCSDDCLYRVSLHTNQGSFPLDAAYISDYHDRVVKVDAINTYLADPEQGTLAVQDGGGLWLLLALAFVAAGVWMGIAPLLGQWIASQR
jgi:hypothetical protein